jgi:DNA excision repair protein ERCC-3
MSYFPENALIIQSDRSVLLEVHSPQADAARAAIAPFAELVKSPEHIHTYQISPLSIWNARAAGMPIAVMISALETHSKYPLPESIAQEIETLGNRYGLTTIERQAEGLILTMADLPLAELLSVPRGSANATIQEHTLILTSSLTSVRQWQRELLDKTTLAPEAIAEYSGESKQTAPITLATYQILSYRASKTDDFPHFQLFNARAWGLIIYDEVHLLPAPIFRITAQLQARRRLGLTATLIREDGKEGDVFALIGPKRYDVPWRELEVQGFIAPAECTEIRVPQDPDAQMQYALAQKRNQFRIAAENPRKYDVVKSLVAQQAGHRILIIGEYLEQLHHLAGITDFPLVTGKTSQPERDRLYQEFRSGKISGLVLSRVGNFALDLPDADVLIQVSGKYGSRQEEAQRLGRVLRPKSDGRAAQFYTLVSLRTCEEDFARHRQLFLSEQGYLYRIETVIDSHYTTSTDNSKAR